MKCDNIYCKKTAHNMIVSNINIKLIFNSYHMIETNDWFEPSVHLHCLKGHGYKNMFNEASAIDSLALSFNKHKFHYGYKYYNELLSVELPTYFLVKSKGHKFYGKIFKIIGREEYVNKASYCDGFDETGFKLTGISKKDIIIGEYSKLRNYQLLL